MGPDSASYQGKKRHDKQVARFKEAMAKKAKAAEETSFTKAKINTVDAAGRETFTKPGHEGWKIDIGPAVRSNAPRAKASGATASPPVGTVPSGTRKVTYGLGKAGTSTVIDLGHEPSPATRARAQKELTGKFPTSHEPPKPKEIPLYHLPDYAKAPAKDPAKPSSTSFKVPDASTLLKLAGTAAVAAVGAAAVNSALKIPSVVKDSGSAKAKISDRATAKAEIQASTSAKTRNRSPQVEAAKARKPLETKVETPKPERRFSISDQYSHAQKAEIYEAAETSAGIEALAQELSAEEAAKRNPGRRSTDKPNPNSPKITRTPVIRNPSQNLKTALEGAERADQRAKFQPPPAPKVEAPKVEAPKTEAPKIQIPVGATPKQIAQIEVAASRATIGRKPAAPTQPAVKAPETPTAPKQTAPRTPSTAKQEVEAANKAKTPTTPSVTTAPEPGEKPATNIVDKTIQKARKIRAKKSKKVAGEGSEPLEVGLNEAGILPDSAVQDSAKVRPKAPTPPPAPPVSTATTQSAQAKIDTAASEVRRQDIYAEARAAARSGDPVKMRAALEKLPPGTKKTEKWAKNLEAGIQSAGNKTTAMDAADKFGATEAEVKAVETSGQAVAAPSAAKKAANAKAVAEAPKEVQDLVSEIEKANQPRTKQEILDAISNPPVETKAGETVNLPTTEKTSRGSMSRFPRKPKTENKPVPPGNPPVPQTSRVDDEERRLGERRNEEAGTRRNQSERMTAKGVAKANPERPAEEIGNKRTSRRERGNERRGTGTPPIPTVEEVAAMSPDERAAKIEEVNNRAAALERSMAETSIAKATGPEGIAEALNKQVTRQTKREEKIRKAKNREWQKEKNRQFELRQSGVDPDTGLPKNPNTALSSAAAEPAPLDAKVEEAGKARGQKAIDKAAQEAAAGKTKAGKVTPIVKKQRTAEEQRAIAEAAVKYDTPEPVDKNELEHKRLLERLHGDVEGEFDSVSSGNSPETERAARHAETQATLDAAIKKANELQKQIDAAKSKKTPGRGERTAESFQPGGATLSEQLASPENADVKRVMRIGMEGGGKFDEKPAEFNVEEVIGKELEDMKERARGADRRVNSPDRRSRLASDIEAEIDRSRELRKGEEDRRAPGERRGETPEALSKQGDDLLRAAGSEDLAGREFNPAGADVRARTPEELDRLTKLDVLAEARRNAEIVQEHLENTAPPGEGALKNREAATKAAAQRARYLPVTPTGTADLPLGSAEPGIGQWRAPNNAAELIEQAQRNAAVAGSRGRAQGAAVDERAPRNRRFGQGTFTEEQRVRDRRQSKLSAAARGAEAGKRGRLPILSSEEFGRLLNAPPGRPGYVAPSTPDSRRPSQFENPPWPENPNMTEAEKEQRAKETFNRYQQRQEVSGPKTPEVTSPSVRGSEAKVEAKPYKGPGGITVRGAVRGGAIATAIFAALNAAEAGAKELGKGPKAAAKAAGTTFYREAPEVAKGLAQFTGIDLMATKVAPAVVAGAAKGFGASAARAGLIRGATSVAGKLGIAGLIGVHAIPYAIRNAKELATQIGEGYLAKHEAASEKKGQEAKYGTVEAATATRKRKEAYKAALKRNKGK